MNIEEVKQKMSEIEKKFSDNKGILVALKEKEKEIFIENTRLQGEHRLLKEVLKKLEKTPEKPVETEQK